MSWCQQLYRKRPSAIASGQCSVSHRLAGASGASHSARSSVGELGWLPCLRRPAKSRNKKGTKYCNIYAMPTQTHTHTDCSLFPNCPSSLSNHPHSQLAKLCLPTESPINAQKRNMSGWWRVAAQRRAFARGCPGEPATNRPQSQHALRRPGENKWPSMEEN